MSELQFDGFDEFRTNEELEANEGVDLKFPGGQVFTILRAGGSNRRYWNELQRINRSARKMRRQGVDFLATRETEMEVYAKTVVIGWQGVTAKGNPVPFNSANCLAFFKANPNVFDIVRQNAEEMEAFKQAEIQEDREDLGNG